MNQPTNASRIRHHLRHRGLRRAGSAAIYSVVLDGENALCLTEPQLDAWWHSLSPEDKAEIYEQHLGDGVERCRFCGCTETRACVTDGQPCCWLDPNHTVCSAPACATRYHAEVFDQVFHGGPQKVISKPFFGPAIEDVAMLCGRVDLLQQITDALRMQQPGGNDATV
jgi:hypothetical protein